MLPKIFRPYDVFISYVAEDREIVEKLYSNLESLGLRVWYARNELFPGAEIRPLINKGLKSSRFGISVITPSYKSHWAYGELFYLMGNKRTFIPVLHQISVEEIAREQPELITRYCLNTADGIEHVAAEIRNHVSVRPAFYSRLGLALSAFKVHTGKLKPALWALLTIVLVSAFLWGYHFVYPDEYLVETSIKQRISRLEDMVQQEVHREIVQNNGSQSSLVDIKRAEGIFYSLNSASSYRNKYDFFNGIDHIKTVAGLKNAQIVPPEKSPEAPFELEQFNAYLFSPDKTDTRKLRYGFVNLLPLNYSIVAYHFNEGLCEVEVAYSNALRYAVVEIIFDRTKDTRFRNVNFYGARPNETYVFEKNDGTWSLVQVR